MIQEVTYSDSGVPIRLPLIEVMKNTYIGNQTNILERYLLVGVQHLQGSVVPFISALLDAGLRADHVFLIGKAYSTHPAVVRYLEELGCWVADNDEMLSLDSPYDSELENQIDKVLGRVVATLEYSPSLSVLLVDEAGRAVRLLHEKYPDYANRFRCVEQTTRGIRVIEQLVLRCPVVNVARSLVKRSIETPFITARMMVGLDSVLGNYRVLGRSSPRRILLIGYGVIGASLANQLRAHDYQVAVYDSSLLAKDRVQKSGLELVTDLETGLRQFSCILGCTGDNSITESQRKYLLDGCLLVNCASSDVEFAAWEMRSSSEVVHTRGNSFEQAIMRPWLNLYRVNLSGGSVYLANGGFPVNFTGEMDPIPPEQFQVTRALMFLGSLQAVSLSTKGITELDEHGQQLVLDQLSMIKSQSHEQ